MQELTLNYQIFINTPETIIHACEIKDKYRYSFYDSLIIASALEAGCNSLYSEDMQHNQMIENTLRILNPFI
ncbi:MAG: PIN domain-containing protein [Bacteroidales bacterium]|nr:PIN domain-containing protein [Bacteroidales bacterium]